MALNFDVKYTPRSNPADAGYPYGSFKNDGVPGDLSGTPGDKDWANDFLGFFQKLLNYAVITPSGVPDTIVASDFFDALVKRINALSQYLVDSGAADAYVVGGDPAYTAYFDGMKIRVKITNINTGASTINVDSLGVKSIVKNVSTPLVAGDLPVGAIIDIQYDGTNFQVAPVPSISGAIVQTVNTQTGAVATGAANTPLFDDSIPINTEGDPYPALDASITPTNASNKLLIEVVFNFSVNLIAEVVLMLFQDSTVNALAVGVGNRPSGANHGQIVLRYLMTAGTTSPTTFKIRAGNNAGTITLNGGGGTREFGGVMISSTNITEIAV